VKRAIAETLPELKASQRLLEKCNFVYIGEGSEPGIIRFELCKNNLVAN
jgi:RimJ/RimL family protein N-acetyltransferase